jgi:tetratricopeptide (TPR) repeat protein
MKRGYVVLASVVGVAAALLLGVAAYRAANPHAVQRFLVTPDAGMSASVFVAPSLAFLRPQLLRTAIASAHLRGSEMVLFEREQKRHPFLGPHLQVIVGDEIVGRVDAEFVLRQGDRELRERYRGTTGGVRYALQDWLAQTLSPDARSPDKGTQFFVSGREAELRFDREQALFDYQRALLREPTMLDAEIAVARLLYDQGRIEEAVATVEAVASRAQIGTVQRCRVELLMVRISPEKLPIPNCPRARMIDNVEKLELGAALNEAKRSYSERFGAAEWLERQDAIITALLRRQEFPQAIYEIDRAQRFARESGWHYAEVRLLEHSVTLDMHRGHIEDAVALRYRLADELDRMGDATIALGHRQLAYRHDPVQLGSEVVARQRQLIALIDRAKAAGAAAVEIDAAMQLARLQRDDPLAWGERIAQARVRMRDAGLDAHRTLHPYFLTAEFLAQRRYSETLKELDRLAAAPLRHPRALSWDLSLRTQASFLSDDLPEAMRTIDTLEKGGIDLTATANVCFLSWVLAEAGDDVRALDYIERCDSASQDRAARAMRGDYALLAQARIARDESNTVAAQALRARVLQLLRTTNPIRQEIESLALLSLYAAQTNAIDRQTLRKAADILVADAQKNGAGPGVRLGAHLLSRRMCIEDGRTDCGEPLPSWAAEDRLWARIADRRILVGLAAGGQ